MNNSISINEGTLSTWLVDLGGNVATSEMSMALLERIKMLAVPFFASTEEAMLWGAGLNPQQRETLVHIQRTASNAARAELNLHRKVILATQSQLIREAAETFTPRLSRAR